MLITKTTHIASNKIYCNGDIVFQAEEPLEFAEFIKLAFKQLCPAYPKFYKMDKLSKLAFLASEVLLKDTNLLEKYHKEDIGLVFLNSSSTIDTDKDHQQTINSRENYFPSPSLFVYTLPNIMMGEICIKNQFFGENALFISEKFDAETLYRQVKLLFENKRLQACITGWVDVNDKNYNAFIMLIEPDLKVNNSKEICNFDVPNINKLFNQEENVYYG